jgi:tight adherence protein B
MSELGLPTLIAIGCLLVTGMAALGMVMHRSQQQSQRVSARLRGVSVSAIRAVPLPVRSISRAAAPRDISLTARVGALFGYHKVRAKHHPMPAWLVLSITLACARGLSALVQGVLGPIALLSVPVTWIIMSRTVFNLLTEKRTKKLLLQFPDALQMIVRAVRVGMPVSEAMRLVSREAQQPTAAEFDIIAKELAIGTPLDEAIKALAERTGIAEYQFFATALSLQQQTGGGLTETLEGLAEVIRKRLALRAKGAAMASEAKASAIVLSALPFVSFGGMFLINRPYIRMMYTTDIGLKMMGMGLASLIVGVLVMRWLIRRSLA